MTPLETLQAMAERSLCKDCKAPIYPFGLGNFPAGFGCKACHAGKGSRRWAESPIEPRADELAARWALAEFEDAAAYRKRVETTVANAVELLESEFETLATEQALALLHTLVPPKPTRRRATTTKGEPK